MVPTSKGFGKSWLNGHKFIIISSLYSGNRDAGNRRLARSLLVGLSTISLYFRFIRFHHLIQTRHRQAVCLTDCRRHRGSPMKGRGMTGGVTLENISYCFQSVAAPNP